jgi:hypothetical protein
MSFRDEQREYRDCGMDNAEILFALLARCENPLREMLRAVESMAGDGTQAIPRSHQLQINQPFVQLDDLPDGGNVFDTLMARPYDPDDEDDGQPDQ